MFKYNETDEQTTAFINPAHFTPVVTPVDNTEATKKPFPKFPFLELGDKNEQLQVLEWEKKQLSYDKVMMTQRLRWTVGFALSQAPSVCVCVVSNVCVLKQSINKSTFTCPTEINFQFQKYNFKLSASRFQLRTLNFKI